MRHVLMNNDSKPGDLVSDSSEHYWNGSYTLKLIFASAEEISYVYVYSDEVTLRHRSLKFGLEVLGTKLVGACDE